jgi:hypothetical protein
VVQFELSVGSYQGMAYGRAASGEKNLGPRRSGATIKSQVFSSCALSARLSKAQKMAGLKPLP